MNHKTKNIVLNTHTHSRENRLRYRIETLYLTSLSNLLPKFTTSVKYFDIKNILYKKC